MKNFNSAQATSASEDSRQRETIIVKKKVNNFVQLDKGFIEDKRLSFKAKGILSYLLSKPDGWKVIVKDLVNHSTDGKHAIYSGLNELKEYGYYHKYPVRDGQRIVRWESVVYECPADHQDEISKMKKEKNHKKNNEEKSEKPMEKTQSSLFTNFQDIDNQDIDNQDIDKRQRSNINIYQEPLYQHNISINRGQSKNQTFVRQPKQPKLIDIDTIDTNAGKNFKDAANNADNNSEGAINKEPIIKIFTKQELADKLFIEELKAKHIDKHQEIDMLYDIMCEVLTVDNPVVPYFRISKQNMPFVAVKNVYKDIEKKHIEYVIHSLNHNDNKYKINKNTKSYLMTALFHAPRTITHYFDRTFSKPDSFKQDKPSSMSSSELFETLVQRSMKFGKFAEQSPVNDEPSDYDGI